MKTAVVSSSRHCSEVIRVVGIADQFDARVDGILMDELGLPGKPAPNVYLYAAKLLEISPSRSVVVEDAIAGVEAGRSGGFGIVVGVDRHGHEEELRKNGADLVVTDLGELINLSVKGPVV